MNTSGGEQLANKDYHYYNQNTEENNQNKGHSFNRNLGTQFISIYNHSDNNKLFYRNG